MNFFRQRLCFFASFSSNELDTPFEKLQTRRVVGHTQRFFVRQFAFSSLPFKRNLKLLTLFFEIEIQKSGKIWKGEEEKVSFVSAPQTSRIVTIFILCFYFFGTEF